MMDRAVQLPPVSPEPLGALGLESSWGIPGSGSEDSGPWNRNLLLPSMERHSSAGQSGCTDLPPSSTPNRVAPR